MPYGLQTVGNIKNFAGYAQKQPVARVVHLSAEQPTKIIEFWYEQTGDIGHDYDLKFTLRWESNSTCDLDLHAYLDHSKDAGVMFKNKTYSLSETDKLWLDMDHLAHGPNGYETEPEVITVLGCAGHTLSLEVDNYNTGNLRSDPVLEISKADGEMLQSISIPFKQLTFGSTGMIWICDVDLCSRAITEKLIPVKDTGVF